MATHFNPNFNPRASQAPVRPKGFFQKVSETVGQLLGLNTGSTRRAAPAQSRDTYGPTPYSQMVQNRAKVIFEGKTRSGERVPVPDTQILSFLDQIRTNGLPR